MYAAIPISHTNRNTSYQILKFTKEEIQDEKDTLPPKYRSLTGAQQIHELVFSPDGTVKGKKLPTDEKYFSINTTYTFAPRMDAGARVARPQVG